MAKKDEEEGLLALGALGLLWWLFNKGLLPGMIPIPPRKKDDYIIKPPPEEPLPDIPPALDPVLIPDVAPVVDVTPIIPPVDVPVYIPVPLPIPDPTPTPIPINDIVPTEPTPVPYIPPYPAPSIDVSPKPRIFVPPSDTPLIVDQPHIMLPDPGTGFLPSMDPHLEELSFILSTAAKATAVGTIAALPIVTPAASMLTALSGIATAAGSAAVVAPVLPFDPRRQRLYEGWQQ